MSRDDVRKALGGWLGKARSLGDPPLPQEAPGVLAQPERRVQRDDELTQLNYKIPRRTKKRIKQLALRDNITLLTMLDRMLALYEREYGSLDRK